MGGEEECGSDSGGKDTEPKRRRWRKGLAGEIVTNNSAGFLSIRRHRFGVFIALVIVCGLGFLTWSIHESNYYDKSYYPSGKIKWRCARYPNLLRGMGEKRGTGPCESWYESGQLAMRKYYRDGKTEGEAVYFNENGSLEDRWTYRAGIPIDGERISKWSNGRYKKLINYKNGHLDGRLMRWSEEGLVMEDWQYLEGVPTDGTRKTFYENGVLESQVSYVAGRKEGLEIRRYSDGKLWFSANWKHGLLNGEVFYEPLKVRASVQDGVIRTCSHGTETKVLPENKNETVFLKKAFLAAVEREFGSYLVRALENND